MATLGTLILTHTRPPLESFTEPTPKKLGDGAEIFNGSLLDLTGGVKTAKGRPSFIQMHILSQNPAKIQELFKQIHHIREANAEVMKVATEVNRTFIMEINAKAEAFSKDEPDEYTYSEYDQFMKKHDAALEKSFLKSVKKMSARKIVLNLPENVDAKGKLQGLLDSHSENLQLLISQLQDPDFYKGKTYPGAIKSLAESILPPLIGMDDLRRQEEGFLDIAQKTIKNNYKKITALEAELVATKATLGITK